MATGKDGMAPFRWYSKTKSYSLGGWSNGSYQRSDFKLSPTSGYTTFCVMGHNTGANNASPSYITPANTWVFRMYNRSSSSISGTITLRSVFLPSAMIG